MTLRNKYVSATTVLTKPMENVTHVLILIAIVVLVLVAINATKVITLMAAPANLVLLTVLAADVARPAKDVWTATAWDLNTPA